MSVDDVGFATVLGEIGAVLSESIEMSQPDPPDLLFHYTNAGGLLGILKTSRLWATNYRFLNDAQEVRYGFELYKLVVENRMSQNKGAVVSEFLMRTLRTVNAFDSGYDCYIACFCESDGLLNQWRDYASSGGGYAIGIKSCFMQRENINDLSQDFVLRKVIYQEEKQRVLLSQVLDSTVAALAEAAKDAKVEEANLLIARACSFVRSHIADYLLCFKHPAFEYENEWRLCHVVERGSQEHVQFRDGPYGLTPYVCLDPSPEVGIYANQLPISRITHGPVSDPENARYALDMLIRFSKYPFVEVAGSKLPMRVGR
ncbi:DUF2971 domain-containing protein [Pseudomonas koreensis]|uniref:DUF2971 domain-containing protein n=1 Tax=Pseudomonas koreensis TaxID=198620 RepID=UPI003F827A30